ncbi:MAG: insulinase family protein [Lachnospiraceae bacterium]|nr:insulinase family protein [Lachnospiraceae bacterium]
MKIEELKTYHIERKEQIPDLNSTGYLLTHNKTGAKVLVLENDDENKVFGIAFRTPPSDSTGVPHIMEHSVLCGSKAFPAKEPFVELAKGSLNTFLNAMTYSDKTVYPVASCNDQDFRNLMHVYLDAVFYPNIYEREQIFKQEGWHYEINNVKEPITINGVVYNEMRGVFSSADDLLDRKIMEVMFPDTAYFHESGGDPQVIPDLTYEQFLDFHRRYYHPSNSYIYLYGNADMAERLTFLDEEYLSRFDKLEIDSSIGLQKPFTEPLTRTFPYSVTEEESIKDKTYLSYTSVIDTVLDRNLYIAFQIIEYALLLAPGAVLNQALLDAGIAKDVQGSYECSTLQPYFTVIAKNSEKEKLQPFLDTVKRIYREVAENGFDKQALLAAINFYEFRYREADFGFYPKGLMYGLQAFDSWLYDENEPFMHIAQNDTYTFLRSQVDTGYFEGLVKKYLLDNPHAAAIVVEPERGLSARLDAELAEKLAAYKESLSDEELEALVEDTKALHRYQEEGSTDEEIASIPLLKVSDIKKEAEPFNNRIDRIDGVTVLTHDIFTNGIGYLTLRFDVTGMEAEDIPYLSLLSNILGLIDTKNYKYAELFNVININTGGITFSSPCSVHRVTNEVNLGFEVRAKVLYDKLPFAFQMIREVLFTSDFSDKKRIRELISMLKSRMEESMPSGGHATASGRALASCSIAARIREYLSGISFYRFVADIEENFDARYDETVRRMQEVLKQSFCQNHLLVDYTAQKDHMEAMMQEAEAFIASIPEKGFENKPFEIEVDPVNEGFKTSSKVQYVAMAGSYSDAGTYTGALRILKTLLGYDYLWNNVRVKGGAYGCMSSFGKTGPSYFTSYRDPNLKKTLDIYRQASDFVRNYQPAERDLTKLIIGTISDMDTPLTPLLKGLRSLSAYITGETDEDAQRERDEVLHATGSDIRKLADYLDAIVSQEHICVVGGEEQIEEAKEIFDRVENLID